MKRIFPKTLQLRHMEYISSFFYKKGCSKTEASICPYILLGFRNREIGSVFNIAEKTVKFHIGNIFKNFKISCRSELIWELGCIYIKGEKVEKVTKKNLKAEKVTSKLLPGGFNYG